jgi:hypothetical protein
VSLDRAQLVTHNKQIFLGGAQIYDITAPQLPATYVITVQSPAPRAVGLRLVSWAPQGYPASFGCPTSYSGITDFTIDGFGNSIGSTKLLVTLTADCPTATLIETTVSPPVANMGTGLGCVEAMICIDSDVRTTFHRPRKLRLDIPFGTTTRLDPFIERLDGTVGPPDCGFAASRSLASDANYWAFSNNPKFELFTTGGNLEFRDGRWWWYVTYNACATATLSYRVINTEPTVDLTPWWLSFDYRDICC